jgi:hypothetical protein
MEHQPKISSPMRLILSMLAIIADLVNWIPGVNIIATIITFAIFQGYFRIKQIPGAYGLVGNVAEFVPGLSVAPWITIAVLITIFVDKNPGSWLGKKVSTATSLAPLSGGKGAPVIKTPKGGLAASAVAPQKQ